MTVEIKVIRHGKLGLKERKTYISSNLASVLFAKADDLLVNIQKFSRGPDGKYYSSQTVAEIQKEVRLGRYQRMPHRCFVIEYKLRMKDEAA